VVLCGCESWSLTLREEHRLRELEDRELGENIWTEDGLSNWRPGNARRQIELIKYNYYDRVKKHELGRACNKYGIKRNAYGILAGKLEGKRPLERPRCRWENNIKIHVKEI
jgi:hypothetical protein